MNVDPLHLRPEPKVAQQIDHLGVSLITSCSEQTLDEVFAGFHSVFPRLSFDLYFLRDVDLRCLIEYYKLNAIDPSEVIATLGAENIAEWLIRQLQKTFPDPSPLLGAFATYFPEIGWSPAIFRKTAPLSQNHEAAVATAMKVAIVLASVGYSKKAVVEIVCGSRVALCTCDDCKHISGSNSTTLGKGLVHQTTTRAAAEELSCSLKRIVDDVEKFIASEDTLARYPNVQSVDWAFALEIEPGSSFLASSWDAVKTIDNSISARSDVATYIGWNLDVAHFELANINLENIKLLNLPIVHSHVSDHALLHSRDMPVGTWRYVTLPDSRLADQVTTADIRRLNDKNMDAGAWRSLTMAYSSLIDKIEYFGAVTRSGRGTALLAIELEAASGWQDAVHSVACLYKLLWSLNLRAARSQQLRTHNAKVPISAGAPVQNSP